MSAKPPEQPWWAVAVATLQSALPLLLLAAAAGYTWWLVQSMPGGERTRPLDPPATEPDYVLERGRVERFDATGRRESVLQGQVMRHYAAGDQLVVQSVRLLAQDAQGGQLQAQAREGRYQGEQATVDLLGQARVTASPAGGDRSRGPVSFEGEALRVHLDTHVLSASRPVVLRSPEGQMRSADLRYDAKARLGVLGGRVQGVYQGATR